MAASTPRITAEEFLSGDYPTGAELLDGVVYEMDAAFDRQEVAAAAAGRASGVDT